MKQSQTEHPELPVDSIGDVDVLDALDDAVDETDVDEPSEPEVGAKRGGRRVLVGFVLVMALVAAVVLAANVLSSSGAPASLPETVSDPSAVLTRLEATGLDCSNAAVVGDIAACTSTVTVRIFADQATADAWVADVVKTANSSIGWAVRGNVVVAAPLERTPAIAAALGAGSRIV